MPYTIRPMAQAREIKKRIGAVKTIQRITKTMQMIATAKFTSAVQRAQAAKPFTARIEQLIGDALAAAPDFEHPLIREPSPSPGKERILVIASNRGLCGAYNANVLRAGFAWARELRERQRQLDLEVAGKKALGFFKFQKIAVAKAHVMSDQPTFDDVEPIAARYIDDFLAGGLDAVYVASMQFISNARQVPKVLPLLPLTPRPRAEGGPGGPVPLYDFGPSPQAILDELMPLAVKTLLFQAFLDATVSEQIMRMIAMKAATDNAKDLGRSLTRRYNRVRQAQITTELMEVIGGAAALD